MHVTGVLITPYLYACAHIDCILKTMNVFYVLSPAI